MKREERIMNKEALIKRKCPIHKVQLEYKGMEDVHTGGRGLEFLELIGSILLGFSIIAIRDLMVKRTTFDFYVCPICRYTIFVEEDSSTNNIEKDNGYREYKEKLKNVSQLLSEIKNLDSY
jgi:hypothetical protein